MNKIKAIVVDDEISSRKLIIKLITQLNSNFEILAEAEEISKAYELIKQVEPQVVFLDIRMHSGTGFELLEMFKEIAFDVVFISGFDNYAIRAFEYNALDYVLKPINPDKFLKTLNKIELKIKSTASNFGDLKNILMTYNVHQLTISKISIHDGNNVIFLNIDEIIHIQSVDKLVFFKMKTDERYASSKELSDFLFILESHPYIVRVSKSTFINLNFVSSYSKGSICFLKMKDHSLIEVPRRKKSEILELLKQKK